MGSFLEVSAFGQPSDAGGALLPKWHTGPSLVAGVEVLKVALVRRWHTLEKRVLQ